MTEKATTESDKKKTKPPRPPVADLNADWNTNKDDDPKGEGEANKRDADDPEPKGDNVDPAPEGAC